MKLGIKKPELNKGKKRKKKAAEPELVSDAVIFGAGGFSVGGFGADDDSDFEVNVRNADAGIRLLDKNAEAGPWWIRELPHEIATSVALMSVVIFILATAYLYTSIPFAAAGVVVYMLLVVLGERFDVRAKYYTAAALFVLLVAAMIVMRKYVGGGLGSIMNMVYDASEAEQAYIYDRLGVGASDENPDLCIKAAVIWASSLFGLIGALPDASARRGLGLTVAVIAMIAFAYYGLIPVAVCVGVIIFAIMMVLARGGLLASLPVLLITMLAFGAVMMIDPGENYGISRADENIRDRLALRSAYLETNLDQAPQQTPEEMQHEQNEPQEEPDDFTVENKWLWPVIIAVALLAAIGAAAYLVYRRYIKRRDANRAGLDSPDIRTAIVAMFPYAVKWLGASEMDVQDKSFASLVEPLKSKFSDQYANYFTSMYVLWREAAYSDHEIDESYRSSMKDFVNDTRDMVQADKKLGAKIKTALKYAL